MVISIRNLTGKGFYTGPYVKNVNGIKGFFPHGSGHITVKINDVLYEYDGDFYEGKITGNGTIITNDDTYKGALVDGIPNGEGEMKYKYNRILRVSIRSGTFKNGKLNGQGTTVFFEHGKYVGNHVDNVIQGKGVYYYPTDRFFLGKFGPQKIESGNV